METGGKQTDRGFPAGPACLNPTLNPDELAVNTHKEINGSIK